MPTFDFRASNTRKLHFFPASLPDETLLSRLSRYHLLSAAREDEHTFQLLFSESAGQLNFAAAAPTPLRRLANQLPGQSRKNLGELLAFNTFVPLVAPILASLEWQHPDPEFGEANFCQHCAVLDKYQLALPTSTGRISYPVSKHAGFMGTDWATVVQYAQNRSGRAASSCRPQFFLAIVVGTLGRR
jgi:hypothetical protein